MTPAIRREPAAVLHHIGQTASDVSLTAGLI
jgi:hypothetical protein